MRGTDKFKAEYAAHRARVHDILSSISRELVVRARAHDKSKMGSPEYEKYEEFYENKDGTLDQRISAGRSYSMAEQLHAKANDHHPEHFEDGIAGMDIIQLVEFVADFLATGEDMEVDATDMLNLLKAKYGIDDQLYRILNNSISGINEIRR